MSGRGGVITKPALFLLITLVLIFTSCGLDEYYYLPPVTQITSTNVSDAEITLPTIDPMYYYFTNFSIFYRIYLSDYNTDLINTQEIMTLVNTRLEEDFRYFNNTFINPANASAPTNSSFINRNYYEVKLSIPNFLHTHGRRLLLNFSSSGAKLTDSSTFPPSECELVRNGNSGFTLRPTDGRFITDSELLTISDTSGPGKTNNGDVHGQTLKTYSCAYVSMYIVTTGTNFDTFHALYSRPTHIGIFRIEGP